VGEITDAMEDGDLCASCGVAMIGEDEEGMPWGKCNGCREEDGDDTD
jgi:hypothetical protein